jgi:hypothetical protein
VELNRNMPATAIVSDNVSHCTTYQTLKLWTAIAVKVWEIIADITCTRL